MVPAIGEQVRQFRVLSKAGEGGMGIVLRAHDTRLGRDVALKFLTHVGAVAPEEAERLRREARSLAALHHGNIVTLFDIDEWNGQPYLVLEWVPGTALSHAAISRPCPEDTFLRIALPVAEALAAAHTRRIVHRDLKPGNVLLSDDGSVKLVDFGIATVREGNDQRARSTTIRGTVDYMSPEQASGGVVEEPSDVFSFGVLGYELLTGHLPFAGDSIPAVLHAIVHQPHVPVATRRPDLSPALAAVLERCLDKRPERRYPGGAAVAQELHHIVREQRASHAPTVAVPTPSGVTGAPARPAIRYCLTRDGVSIAYSVHGSGPLLVRVLGWFTHVDMEWEWPALRRIWERLAATHTVVRYDGRGIGLSGAWPGAFTEETRQLDLAAVLDAVGAEQVLLYGISEGGWTAALHTSLHPARVSHLVLYGSYARGARLREGYDPDEMKALVTLMRKGWGRDTPEYRQIFTLAYFGEDADPGLIAHFNQLQRAAADGDTAARYQESLWLRGDARETFAEIRVPTLVIHCRDDQIISFEEGRLIASIIPGAQFLPLPTGTHYFPVDDEVTDRIGDAIDEFSGVAPAGR